MSDTQKKIILGDLLSRIYPSPQCTRLMIDSPAPEPDGLPSAQDLDAIANEERAREQTSDYKRALQGFRDVNSYRDYYACVGFDGGEE